MLTTHSKYPSFEGGREPINSGWSADVRFEAHYRLKPDTAPCPKSADAVEKGVEERSEQ
jgi:hypothetical protein